MGCPVGMRVARQAYAGLSQVNSPASRDSMRTSRLVRPHSRRGERTDSSRRARIPGRSPASSEALVPSSSTVKPSASAAAKMVRKIICLQ